MINRGWIPAERIEYELNEGRQRKPIEKDITGTVRRSEMVNLKIVLSNFIAFSFIAPSVS